MKRRFNSNEYQMLCICELSNLMDQGNRTFYRVHDIVEYSEIIKGASRISLILDDAVGKELVERYDWRSMNDSEPDFVYRLSPKGLLLADEYFTKKFISETLSFNATSDAVELEFGIGHNSGAIVDLTERQQDVEAALEKIDTATATVRNDNQIDEESKEATLSAFRGAREVLVRGGKQFLATFVDPIVIGIRVAIQKVAAEQAKPILEGIAKWFIEKFWGAS